MRYLILIFCLLSLCRAAEPDCIRHDCVISTNLPADLIGILDTRPGTWGTAGSRIVSYQFTPPIGYRVRITRLDGDLIAWVHGMPIPASHSGVLVALASTTVATSNQMQCVENESILPCAAEGCFLYIQGSVSSEDFRGPINEFVDGLLGEDNRVVITLATFLNDTGQSIHLEITAVIRFKFEKEE